MYLVSFQFFVCKLPSGCWRIPQLVTLTSEGTELCLSVVHQLLPEEQPQEYSVNSAHLLLSKEKPYSVVCYFCISCHRRNPTVINCNIVCHLLKILKYKNFILIDVCYTYILTD